MRLTIFAPSLFSELAESYDQSFDARRWPSLALLIARAKAERLGSDSAEENLLSLCGLPTIDSSALPIAALTALVDCDRTEEAGLMRIDPVHLRADPNQILLFNSPAIAPSAEEADSLLDSLNRGMPELGIFRGRHAARWYVKSGPENSATTCSPNSASGRSIADFLPQGSSARILAQTINEAQMVLHDAPVNLARDTDGKPAINSIWPWGGGSLGCFKAERPDLLIGNDGVLCGVAKHTSTNWVSQLSIEQLFIEYSPTPAHVLCVVSSPNGSVDGAEQNVNLDEFDRDWAKAIIELLRRFKLEWVRIVTDRESFRATPWDIYSVWRRSVADLVGRND